MLNDQQIDNIKNNGYLLLRQVIDSSKLKSLEEEFYQNKDSLQCLSDWVYLDVCRNIDPFLQFIKSSVVLPIAEQIVDKEIDLFWDTIVDKPGKIGKSFLWHQDSGYGDTDPLEYYTFWIPFQKTTRDNGCLWAIPGTHKEGVIPHHFVPSTDTNYPGKQIREVDENKKVSLEMELGDILIFSSLLIHCSGLNSTDEKRTAMALAVNKRGYKEFNLPPSLKPTPGLPLN